MVNYITITPSASASILVYGYMYDHLSQVYLSSGSVHFPSLTAINSFSNSHRVSAICPPFSGYHLPSNYYNVIDKNRLKVSITNFLSGTGLVDIIFYNIAGYTKLSDKSYFINISS